MDEEFGDGRYFVDTDRSDHQYLVPFECKEQWDKWNELPFDDERSWDAPHYATLWEGELLTFEKPELL